MLAPVDDIQAVEELIVGSLLFGLYLPTLFCCVRCLVWDGNLQRLQWPKLPVHWILLISTLILCACSSLNLALGILRSHQAFVQCLYSYPSVVPSSTVSNWFNVVKAGTTFATILITTGILVYRCWNVYNRRFLIIAVPLLLWLSELCISIAIVYIESFTEDVSILDTKTLKPLLLAICVIPIPVNLILTGLIVLRIWEIQNSQFSSRPSTFQHLNRIIIESGFLYFVVSLFSFITYVARSDLFYVATSVAIRVSGIAFNLLIIRTHNQRERESSRSELSGPLQFQNRFSCSIDFSAASVKVEPVS